MVPRLTNLAPEGEAGNRRLWVYSNAEYVVYDYAPTKHGTDPAAYVEGFKGVIRDDGGSDYNEAVRQRDLTRARFWSHARRYFFDAGDTSEAFSKEALVRIGGLFDIESG